MLAKLKQCYTHSRTTAEAGHLLKQYQVRLVMVDHVDNSCQIVSTINPADALVNIVCNNPNIHDFVYGLTTQALFRTTSANYRQTD